MCARCGRGRCGCSRRPRCRRRRRWRPRESSSNPKPECAGLNLSKSMRERVPRVSRISRDRQFAGDRSGAAVNHRGATRSLPRQQTFEYVEPDRVINGTYMPNDPLLRNGTLWNLDNIGLNGGSADADIDAPEAGHPERRQRHHRRRHRQRRALHAPGPEREHVAKLG